MNKKKWLVAILYLMTALMFSVCALAAEDVSWYDDSKTEFQISTADQLRGLSKLSAEGILKSGITINLTSDIDFGNESFEPINEFSGIFDGKGHTIKNINMDHHLLNTHNYISMFRKITDTTIRNLNIQNAQVPADGCCQPEHKAYSTLDSYFAETAIVAGMAYGDCVFDNIKITDSYAAAYNNSVGGVLAEAYGDVVFKKINIDASNEFEAFWGTPDGVVGGVLGMLDGGASAEFEDCYIAPVMDVFNDATANYQYFWYRMTGMLVGRAEDGNTNRISAKNVKVGFCRWNQYYYCEFRRLGQGSYNAPDEWKYERVDPNNANHEHAEDETHLLLLPFENLVGFGTGIEPYKVDNGSKKNPDLWKGLEIVWCGDKDPDAPKNPVVPENPDLPKTGDNSSLPFFTLLMALSGVTLVALKKKGMSR